MTTITTEPLFLTILQILQSPIPQYVLGSLPAIATIGTTPRGGFGRKVMRILICLSCPFVGIFYFCNISGDPVAMSAYWLSSRHFIYYTKVESPSHVVQDEDPPVQVPPAQVAQDGNPPTQVVQGEIPQNFTYGKGRYTRSNKYIRKPFGFHAKKIISLNEIEQHDSTQLPNYNSLRDCVTEISILDRVSSFISAYYILIGVVAGIYKAAGPCFPDKSYRDWPYIPLSLIWTLPAVCIRMVRGKTVDRDPDRSGLVPEIKILVVDYEREDFFHKQAQVAITALVSIALPWIVVLIAYFTYPVGFYCRSRYLTIICSMWSITSILAIISHAIGEEKGEGKRRKECGGHFRCRCLTYVLFVLFGIAMVFLLAVLSFLANFNSLWIKLVSPIFKTSCDVPIEC